MGAVWSDGTNGGSKLLVSCYRNSLQINVENQIQTIVFQSISTGFFGYPIMQASKIALNEARNFLLINPLAQKVRFVCFSDNLFLYQSHLQ